MTWMDGVIILRMMLMVFVLGAEMLSWVFGIIIVPRQDAFLLIPMWIICLLMNVEITSLGKSKASS